MAKRIQIGDIVKGIRPYWTDRCVGRVVGVSDQTLKIKTPAYRDFSIGLESGFIKISEAEYFKWLLKSGYNG